MILEVTHPLLFASSIPHGLTDVWSVDHPSLLFPYLSLLLPDSLFEPWITPLFLAGSLSHMSRDLGRTGSSLLHIFWGERLLRGKDALGWATLYLSLVHTPLHYMRKNEEGVLVGRGRMSFLAASTAASLLSTRLLFFRLSPYGSTWFRFTSRSKRCVLSHILVEDFLSRPKQKEANLFSFQDGVCQPPLLPPL
jgi:hypothetical protein